MTTSDEAREVHAAATIVDLHADTAKLMSRGYDVARRHRPPWPLSSFAGHVDLPRLAEGGVAGVIFGLWTFPVPARGAAADVDRQLDALEAATAATPERLRLAVTAEDVRAARRDGAVAALRGIEGGQCLEGDLARLAHFARRGVRSLGLVHFSASGLGHPSFGLGRDDGRGLTPMGCEAVDACRDLGLLVDLAHVNRAGFLEAAARYRGPLLVSHTGLAGVRRHWRNLDDDLVKVVARSGGVVGVMFSPRFLGGELDAVVDHLLHLVDVGGRETAAIGSDWDGMVRPARGLEGPDGLPRLTEALLARGLDAEAVHLLLGGNALRLLAAVPPRAFTPRPEGGSIGP